MRFWSCLFVCQFVALSWPCVESEAADIDSLVKVLHDVGAEGKGNPQAVRAWQELAKSGPESLPKILAALDDSSPLAANWIGSAVDTIAERAVKHGALPTKALENFITDRSHSARGRRLAYQWLVQVDRTAPDRLIPGMLNDPSVEFRRDAVTRLLDEASSLFAEANKDTAKLLKLIVYRRALDAARDNDQVQLIVKELRKLGDKVDLQQHFGFLTQWKIVGPFDNSDRKGFDVAFPPEKQTDLRAKYQGVKGEVRWEDFSTNDDYGMVDLNQPYGPLKSVLAYAYTEFDSDRPQQVELRLGCKNAWKVWLNGSLLFARDEYHRGMRLDQYRMKADLKVGRNQIMLKICQNEQQETWTVQWQFQIRVCDETGTAILSNNRTASSNKVSLR